MVFGKGNLEEDSDETHVSETQNNVDLEDDIQEINPILTSSGSGSLASGKRDDSKPLLDEVITHGAGNSKNAGGSKQWTCNHCKKKFTSTYTCIHVHFFGPPMGKKAEISRCLAVLKDRALVERLFKKVKDAEKFGVSNTLKNSVLSKSAPSKKGIQETFSMLERSVFDLKIIRGLCANGIPFNVLRNPQLIEMVSALKNAPAGYKPPSSEKACTIFPTEDKEVANGVLDSFERIAESEEEFTMLRNQFATFHMKKEIYERAATQADAVTMDAIDWWGSYGSETPELAKVAKKVLSQPISSSSAERNWSTYSYIHSVKRNHLNSKRADKLVFIHSNIGLYSRFTESYKMGPSKKRDMNAESTCLECSCSRLVDRFWEDFDEENVENGKRQRID